MTRTTLLKLYKFRYQEGYQSDLERTKEFLKIYKKHGVKVITGGQNVEDPLEGYFITAYRDNAHYEETVAKMHADPKYMEMTQELQASRASIEVTTLKVPPEYFELLDSIS